MASISLGDADVWDDSALIRSWDEALQEYKKYHSIHARGEKVEAVLEAHLKAEETKTPISEVKSEQDDQSVAMSEDEDVGEAMVTTNGIDAQHHGMNAPPRQSPEPAAIPATLLAGHDPVQQNLMMSWYWTGYYSGLQAAQTVAKPRAQTASGAEKT